MKATARPVTVIPVGQYVCRRCGRQVIDSDRRNLTTCRDCRTIEADLADPTRIERLDRQLDPQPRTTCANGHDLDETNRMTDSRGWVQCRMCRRESDQRRRGSGGAA